MEVWAQCPSSIRGKGSPVIVMVSVQEVDNLSSILNCASPHLPTLIRPSQLGVPRAKDVMLCNPGFLAAFHAELRLPGLVHLV